MNGYSPTNFLLKSIDRFEVKLINFSVLSDFSSSNREDASFRNKTWWLKHSDFLNTKIKL